MKQEHKRHNDNQIKTKLIYMQQTLVVSNLLISIACFTLKSVKTSLRTDLHVHGVDVNCLDTFTTGILDFQV